MSVNDKMTALADEIRELSGTTTAKSIDAMTSDVGAANTEIAEQTDLLEQIAVALDNKAAGGTSIIVDEELSMESTNPVQNKVISEALSGKLPVTVSSGKSKISVTEISPEGSGIRLVGETVYFNDGCGNANNTLVKMAAAIRKIATECGVTINF